MEFIQGCVTRSFGLSTATSGFGEAEALSSISSEENQRARAGHPTCNQTSCMQPISPPNSFKSSKQANSFLDHVDDGDELGGPLKLFRREQLYSSSRQSDHQQLSGSSSPAWTSGWGNGFALMKGSSCMDVVDHSPWAVAASSSSPASAYISDGVMHGSHSYVMGDSGRVSPRTDFASSTNSYACSPRDGRIARPFYQYNSAVSGNRSTASPFTASQWAELEDQAMIFKYMMAGTSIPAHLLGPILKNIATVRGFTSLPYRPSSTTGWGNFYPGAASNPDPEPGRCRRTDGKKWRCAREAVTDQKYCDRHIHRGRNRAKKPNSQTQPLSSPSSSAVGPSSFVAAASSSSSPLKPSCAPAAAASGSGHGSITPTQLTFSGFGSRNRVDSYNGSEQFQLPFQMNFSAMANKDHNRYATGNGSCKEDVVDVGSAEQLFFSQLRGRDQPSVGQSSNNPCMQNRDKFFPPFPDSLSPASKPDVQCGGLLHHYTSSHRKNDPHFRDPNEAGTDFEQHHSQSFMRSTSEYVSTVDASKECAEQPLRHFFDDWPREKDPSSISWMDQSKEEKPISNGCGTQLSISIPMAAASKADSDPATCNTPSRPEKSSLPPLTLSMSSPADQENLPPEQSTQMSPDMSIALGMQDRHRQQQNNIPLVAITWEAPVGGPLAEMLQSSSNTPGGSCSKPSSGLNLLCEGWESGSRQRSTDRPHTLPSAAHDHVLQNAEAAADDNGSRCSSPHGS